MIIHVVQPGDTINSIAAMYGVSAQKIIMDNEIDPNNLVVGQTLVILIPELIHTVAPGETLDEIARNYNTTTIRLLQNNPYITDANAIQPGNEIVITYAQDKLGDIAINAYAYPFIDRETLIKTLPYLTYLSIFTYGITPEGDLVEIDDEELIRLARDYGVAPLMVITTLTEEGSFSSERASEILSNPQAQENLINNIVRNVREKNYYGVDIDFEFVPGEYKEEYAQFVRNLTERLNAEGHPVFIALAPKTSADQPGLLYEAHDYEALGEAANKVLLMTYEWGYTYGPAMAVAPINNVRQVLDYAITEIPPEKIYLGIPNYGYDFIQPYVEGESRADSISNVEGVEIAAREGVSIQYDEEAQAPFIVYYDDQGREHNVWFEDARSIMAKLELIDEYGFEGAGYWHIMNYFPQNWLIASTLFDINKVI